MTKENCRWATRKEQSNNFRGNKTATMKELCDELSLSYGKIQTRSYRKNISLAKCIGYEVKDLLQKAREDERELCKIDILKAREEEAKEWQKILKQKEEHYKLREKLVIKEVREDERKLAKRD